MKFIAGLLFLIALGGGAWYTWNNVPSLRESVQEKMNAEAFRTLEVRFSADEIMSKNRAFFLKSSSHSFLEPELLYFPYVMMEVKYSRDAASTSEGILLWSLKDGEMVLDTQHWEQTHGFEDCLLAKATEQDFKVLHALIESKGVTDREKLYHKFKVEENVLNDWIDSCKIKKLVVASGNKVRLHFNKPKLAVEPITHLGESLVTQPVRYSTRVKSKYTVSQIKKFTQVVFGVDFAIRKTQEVFLPVYQISVKNPDNSVLSTYWNALNGRQLESAN